MDLPADELPQSSSAGTAVQKVSGTYGKELNCLASGQGLEGQLFHQTFKEVLVESTFEPPFEEGSSFEPSPHLACRCSNTISESPSIWLTLVIPPW